MSQASKAPVADEPPAYRLDDQVGFILRRVTQRHLSLFAERIPDLTPTQFAALAKLNEVGPLSQNALGRQTAMDAATIKGVIDRLRSRGYVKTAPDPTDMRRMIVSATKAGAAAFCAVEEAAHEITAATLQPLSQADRARFLELLRKLV